MEPDKKEQKINPLYIIAWCAFLLVPSLALYTGWKHHSMLAVVIASLALAGFLTLIFIALRHNRRINSRAEKEGSI